MKFEDLKITLNSGLEAIISVDDDGVYIYPEGKRKEMTSHEMAYLTICASLYIVSGLKGIVMTPQTILNKAHALYIAMLEGKYRSLRSIADMTVKEFNEEIKRYDGRE